MTTLETLLGEPNYSWKQNGKTLVQFSFTEKNSRELGILPGVTSLTQGGEMEAVDRTFFRASVERLLKNSRKSLTRPSSPIQANLLVMQSVNFLFADKTMADALYGDEIMGFNKSGMKSFRKVNGLFRPNKFTNICGLILVPSEVSAFSERFEGDYFPHPSHLANIESHPKPFDEIMFRCS